MNWRCTNNQPTHDADGELHQHDGGALAAADAVERGDEQSECDRIQHGADRIEGMPARGVRGRKRCASHSATGPAGTCNANSQGQDSTDMIAAATDGPAAEEPATISALKPMPRPSRCARIDEAHQRAVDAHDPGAAEALAARGRAPAPAATGATAQSSDAAV